MLTTLISVNIFGDDDPALTASVSKQSSGHDCVDGPDSIQTYDSVTSTTSKAFKQYKIEKFYKSIKSRLIVAEVIKRYLLSKYQFNIPLTF